MLAPNFRFEFHSTDPSLSNLTPENIAQLVIYGAVAALVLHSRRMLVRSDRRYLRKGPFVLWPLIALGSTLWSVVPLFTFVRALQLFVPIGLALIMVRVWLVSSETAAALWRDTLRRLVDAVTLLILIGFATGFWREPRFTWPGAHPGTAATYTAVALLILIAGGRSFLGLRTFGYLLRIALFATTLYLGESRSVLAGVLLAIAVLFWWTARTHPLKSYVGVTYYTIAIGLVLIAARPEIMKYALRGGTTEGLTSLNGRIPLWTESIHLVSQANRWLIGFGYGSARVILPTHVDWAGTAHSAWVEALFAAGILGPLFLAADVVFVGWHASSRRFVAPPALTLSLLALLVVTSFTGEGLVFPGLSFVMLAFLHAPILTERNSVRRHLRTRDPTASHDALAVRLHRRPAPSTPGDPYTS